MIRDQRTARARLLVCAVVLATSALVAPAAQAANLIAIQGDPEIYLDGTLSYDLVYVDGPGLHLAGSTVINAREVILGPNTVIDSCALPPSNATCPANTDSRGLTISAIGSISIANGISLNPQGNGFGGPLTLSGGSVSVSGPINTTGTNGSGPVSISSATVASVGDITANGAQVTLGGGTGVLAGAINTSNGQPGGSVSIASGAGDALVGAIAAFGRDGAGNAPGSGGGTVTINAGEVRVGAIDVTGGNGAGGAPGATSGAVGIAARAGLSVLGTIDASGSNGTGGGSVVLTAGGSATVAGINAFAGPGTTGGGAAVIRSATAAVGNVNVYGGSPGAGPAAGGPGGSLDLVATGAATLGSVNASGGNANGASGGGLGGTVVASGGALTVGAVATSAGTSGGGAPGSSGGGVALTGGTGLTIGGTLTSRGGDAGPAANTPPQPGGTGGAVLLRALAGNLGLAGVVRTQGGRGGTAAAGLGAVGGAGGPVDLIGSIVAPLTGIDTSGGDGGGTGDNIGPGGGGGSIRAFTQTAVFDGLLVIATTGGDGTPAGPAGVQLQNSAPTGLAIDATGLLSFTSQSPLAQGYRVYRTLAGKTEAVLDTTLTSKLAPPATPICADAVYSVAAFRSDIGWVSAPTAPVAFTRQPTGGSCTVAPKLTSPKVERRVKFLKRGAWKIKLRLKAAGVGTLAVELLPGRKPLKKPKVVKKSKDDSAKNDGSTVRAAKPVALATKKVAKPGALTVSVTLPKAARRTGIYRLRITGTPLVGKKTTVTTITLEVSE